MGNRKPVVGDVFVESWGYNQTNVNFFEVVRVSDKSVWLREVQAKVVDGDGNSVPYGSRNARLAPDKGNYKLPRKNWDGGYTVRGGKATKEGVFRKVFRLRENGSTFVVLTSYSNGYLQEDESATYWDTLAAGLPGH